METTYLFRKYSKNANSTMAFLKRNLKSYPEQCKKSAYISLVRSILDYSAIILDPYYIQDIDKLERIQKQATRFIIGDYNSREEGCVTKCYTIWDLNLYRNDAASIVFCSTTKWSRGWCRLCHPRNFSIPHVQNAKLEPNSIQAL